MAQRRSHARRTTSRQGGLGEARGWRWRRHERLMSRSEWPSFVLLFSFLSFRKNHNRESAAVFVWLLIIQADGRSMSPPPLPPSHPHAPLLPPSQIQARCQRENKQKTEEEKQKGVDGFSANAIKRLFTSEGEEPAGCQAAGGGRLGGGCDIGFRRGNKTSRWCDLFIPVVSFPHGTEQQHSGWKHDSVSQRNTKHQQSPGPGR